MPPHIRMPTAEFRSLLLPPIRIPIRTLQSLVRPRCARAVPSTAPRPTQCLGQCRSLHLYKTARSKTLLGQHKVLHFAPYVVAPLRESEHRVNLAAGSKDAQLVAENISLQELYDHHVAPGKMLYLLHDIKKSTAEKITVLKEQNWPEQARTYTLMEPYDLVKKGSKEIKVNDQKGMQLGELKNIILRLSSPKAHFSHCLDRAYQFIAAGSPVEFRIRIKGSVSKTERQNPTTFDDWRWMHNHWPHLRPDFILKSMPEGSSFLIDPVSDGYIVQFVISLKAKTMPKASLNKRLWKVKSGVEHSTKAGKQSQLPRYMRQELVDAGVEDYSPNSGLPKAQALAGYTRDKSVAEWGLKEEEVPRPLLFTDKGIRSGKEWSEGKSAVYQNGDPDKPVPVTDWSAMMEEREENQRNWVREQKRMNTSLGSAWRDDFAGHKKAKKQAGRKLRGPRKIEDAFQQLEALDQEFDRAVVDARSVAQNMVEKAEANDGQSRATGVGSSERREEGDYEEKRRQEPHESRSKWHVRGRSNV